MLHHLLATAGLAAALLTTGCTTRPVNPSFSTSLREAKQTIGTATANPVALERPVVVCAGWADPGFVSSWWPHQIRKSFASAEGQTLGVNFAGHYRFDTCRDKLIAAVDAAFPTDDPDQTVEVDVIAFSMGGLVARHAAADPLGHDTTPRRLNIRRLFTISSPHRGAVLAHVPTAEPRVKSMRAGSPLLAHLDAAWPDRGYDCVAYTRLHDPVVGSGNTAPPGLTPYWLAPPPFARSHQEAYRDPRIVADILRRLRDETPLAAGPPTPLPCP